MNITSAMPGATVMYTVTNLSPGSLRLDYDVAPIVGPIPVTDSTYTGTFIVPNDRPVPITSTIYVAATNLVGGSAVGDAFIPFQPQQPSAPPNYTITNFALQGSNLRAGDPFTLTGVIDPAPSGSLSQYRLTAMWKHGANQWFPFDVTSSSLQSNGSFEISGLTPSLFTGDPAGGSGGDQVNVTFSPPNGFPSGVTIAPQFGDPPPLRIRVVGPQGQPIPGAVVSVRGIASLTTSNSGFQVYTNPEGGYGGTSLDDVMAEAPNQFAYSLSARYAPGGSSNPFACPATDVYGKTDSNGIFQPNLHWDDILGGLGAVRSITIPGRAPTYFTPPTTGTIPIYVNALSQGYGTVINGEEQVYSRTIEFWKSDMHFHNPGNPAFLDANPLTVMLPAVPPGVMPQVPLDVNVLGAIHHRFLGGYPGFGDFISLSDLANDHSIGFDYYPLPISFDYDNASYPSLAYVDFILDGRLQGQFTTQSDVKCAGALHYEFDVQQPYRLQAGWHTAKIVAHLEDGSVTTRTIGLNFVNPAALAWFHDPSYKGREVLAICDEAGWRPIVNQP